jgi:hypothetical protein
MQVPRVLQREPKERKQRYAMLYEERRREKLPKFIINSQVCVEGGGMKDEVGIVILESENRKGSIIKNSDRRKNKQTK